MFSHCTFYDSHIFVFLCQSFCYITTVLMFIMTSCLFWHLSSSVSVLTCLSAGFESTAHSLTVFWETVNVIMLEHKYNIFLWIIKMYTKSYQKSVKASHPHHKNTYLSKSNLIVHVYISIMIRFLWIPRKSSTRS